MTPSQYTRLPALSAVSLDSLRLQWQVFGFATMKEVALKDPNDFDNAYNSSSGSSKNLKIFARHEAGRSSIPEIFLLIINNSWQAARLIFIHSFIHSACIF